MPIKNYTTTIAAEKSVSQIQDLLRRKGARRVLVDYDEKGRPEAVAFEVEVAQKQSTPLRLPFRIRARPEAMKRCLRADPDVPRRYRTLEQAERVAWRLVYN